MRRDDELLVNVPLTRLPEFERPGVLDEFQKAQMIFGLDERTEKVHLFYGMPLVLLHLERGRGGVATIMPVAYDSPNQEKLLCMFCIEFKRGCDYAGMPYILPDQLDLARAKRRPGLN